MVANGIARIASEHARDVNHEIQVVNRYYRAAGRHGAVLAAFSILVTLLATIGFGQLGMFQALTPTGLGKAAFVAWRHQAYTNWWANYQRHPVGWMAYVILSSIGAYYSILLNVVGGPILHFLWRTRRLIRYEANVDSVDGYWGYMGVRQVMRYTYTALVIHGVGFALLAFVMPAPLAVLFLIPLLAQWLTVLVFDTFIPSRLLGPSIRLWKARELKRIQLIIDRHRAASGYDDSQREAVIAPLRQWADRVREVRTYPFGRPRDILYVGLSVTSAIVTILGAIRSTGSGP